MSNSQWICCLRLKLPALFETEQLAVTISVNAFVQFSVLQIKQIDKTVSMTIITTLNYY